jgi:hypothetical protein
LRQSAPECCLTAPELGGGLHVRSPFKVTENNRQPDFRSQPGELLMQSRLQLVVNFVVAATCGRQLRHPPFDHATSRATSALARTAMR